jgi:hypothetical protein
MNLEAAKNLKKKMPWKKIYYDSINACYRLIRPTDLYEYFDEETGRYIKRNNFETFNPINS